MPLSEPTLALRQPREPQHVYSITIAIDALGSMVWICIGRTTLLESLSEGIFFVSIFYARMHHLSYGVASGGAPTEIPRVFLTADISSRCLWRG